MKKMFLALIIVLLSTVSLSSLPVPVYASNSISVVPSTAYVGMFRTIFIYVSASDTATGIWETGVWADVSTVPTDIWIDFDPAFVRFSSSIESRMLVYAGPAASPGTYSITIKAGWTTIIGQHWETQTTFTLQVKAVSERYWAQNPSLLLQNPPNPTPADKWHPGVRQWNPITLENWEVSNTENLYVNWNVSGRVDMMAKAADSNNIDQVAHFIQGLPEGTYQPPPVTLNPQKTQINLKGAVTDIFTTFPDDPLSWTGIKWDLYATSTKDGRTLYIELYFVRTGGNLLWEATPPVGFSVHPGHNEVLKLGSTWDNALLAINESSLSFNQAFVSIVTLGPTTWFSIDVTGIFGFVAYEYATFFPEVWDSSRSINDYNLTQVALCLEANNNGGSVTPQCSISLEDFELKGSYLADINLDGKIDNTDVTTVNNALNSALGDSGYLPNADLNLDRIIDSTDLAMVTNSVGKTFPAPWLTVSSSAGGTTSPAPGTYLYDYGSSVIVTAFAYSHYYFDHWVLDGATVYGNPINVTMDSDHILNAYFERICNLNIQSSGPGTLSEVSTINIQPSGDAVVDSLNPNTNYGSQPFLSTLGKNIVTRSYLKFDLSSIPTDANIISAIEYLYVYSQANSPIIVSSYFVSTDSWSESTITWNNKPSYGDLLSTSTPFSQSYIWVSWDITSQVKTEQSGDKIISVLMKITDENTYQDAYYFSKESTWTQKPYLQVTYAIGTISGNVTYNEGQTVTVTAIPNSGKYFWFWIINNTGLGLKYYCPLNTLSLTLSGNYTHDWNVTAYFGNVNYPKGTYPLTIIGDVNFDGKVDMLGDISPVSRLFGKCSTNPDWESSYAKMYDLLLIPNNQIDIFDIRLVSKQFGKVAP